MHIPKSNKKYLISTYSAAVLQAIKGHSWLLRLSRVSKETQQDTGDSLTIFLELKKMGKLLTCILPLVR